MMHLLNGHVVTGALGGGAPPLVVDLGGGDVAMTEEVLDLADVDAGVEEEGGGGGAEGVRGENALRALATVSLLDLLDGAGQLLQIIFNQ